MWVSQVLCPHVSLPGLGTACEHLHQEDRGCTQTCRLITISFLAEGRGRLKPQLQLRLGFPTWFLFFLVATWCAPIYTHMPSYVSTACPPGTHPGLLHLLYRLHAPYAPGSSTLILSTFLWPFLILIPATLQGLLFSGRVP